MPQTIELASQMRKKNDLFKRYCTPSQIYIHKNFLILLSLTYLVYLFQPWKPVRVFSKNIYSSFRLHFENSIRWPQFIQWLEHLFSHNARKKTGSSLRSVLRAVISSKCLKEKHQSLKATLECFKSKQPLF